MTAGRRLVWAIGLALLLAVTGPASAVEHAWLLGRWEMTRDPDGGPKDWLEFTPDGRVSALKLDGQRMSGRYMASESEVELNFRVGTLSVIITLVPGFDRTELFARSAKTGNTAVYEKRQ